MSSVQEWTFGAIAASAAVFALLEHRVPYNRGQRLFREGFWNDLVLYCLVQSYVLGLIIARLVTWIDAGTGWTRLHVVSAWSAPVQLAFFIVTHDLYIYLFHRLQHRSTVLWRLHEAHHSTPNVDWLSGVRSHSLEILINQTIEFAPMILLGASPEVIVLKGAVSAVWGMFIHSNIDARLGKLQFVINGPEMHRWHHATDARAFGKNFSTKLAIWDWLFGTAYLPDPRVERATGYGLVDRVYPENFPAGYFAQHALAFRPDDTPANAVTAESRSTPRDALAASK
jgi:sterol desaturase/sphingolipid hydroxylase (fatty acid hydroxylase superfamily)